MASEFSPLARLLLGNLADAPASVRQRMLATIPTTMLSLAFYSFTLLVICATTAYIARTAWAWGWLIFSMAMIAWRFLCPVIARRRGQPEPLVEIMVSAGLSMISFGFGSTMSILSGDIALMTISLSGSMGILAGLATRWAALPRPAIASMVLTTAGTSREPGRRAMASRWFEIVASAECTTSRSLAESHVTQCNMKLKFVGALPVMVTVCHEVPSHAKMPLSKT